MNRIREHRAALGWSLQRLAESVGTTKSQIDKLEKGARRLTVDWMVRLAKPLGCDPRDLMALGPAGHGFDMVHFGETDTSVSGNAFIPVRGAAANARKKSENKQDIVLAEKAIDHVPRPYYLAHAKDAYAIYAAGDTMVPMFRPRQMLFINPYKLPSVGHGVVIIDKKGAVRIREFIKQMPNRIKVREYQPRMREYTIAQGDLAAVHAVVGTAEP